MSSCHRQVELVPSASGARATGERSFLQATYISSRWISPLPPVGYRMTASCQAPWGRGGRAASGSETAMPLAQ